VLGEERPKGKPAERNAGGAARPATETTGTGKVTAGRPVRVIAVATAASAVAAFGGAYALVHSGGAAARATAAGSSPHGAAAAAALRVTSITPAAGAGQVNGAYLPVTVTFSAPLAAGSLTPVLRPAVPGHWQRSGAALQFTPSAPFPPAARMTVRVPAGLRSAAGGALARPLVTHFRTESYSPARLSQLLSQLGYMPVSWSPFVGPHLEVAGAGGGQATVSGDARGMTAQVEMAESPPPGRFTWDPGYPSQLHGQWRPDTANLIEKGALMAFQSQHGLPINGIASPRVWDALFRAADAGRRNEAGYTYAIASKSLPETLTIWHDGHQVMRSLANTGIPVSPTVDGTFPVYLRYRFQIMSGTNPDGSAYADPVSFVSYFNGGDAVHYFPRGSYGWQQSLGCVELPYTSAERAWPYLTYGSLVSVTG
jgi:Bacterial Ig-like domain/L,D-transpeptidase catalytic domain